MAAPVASVREPCSALTIRLAQRSAQLLGIEEILEAELLSLAG